MKKLITHKEAKAKYGVVISKMQKLDKVKFYLTEDGDIIDSLGDTRYLGDKNYIKQKYKELLTAIKSNIEQVNIGKENGQDNYIPMIRLEYIATEME